MNEEPLIPQSTEYWTLDQLLTYSLTEMRKRLGVPKVVVEADKAQPDHVTDSTKVIEDKKEEN
jgi:hypothetical protein